MTPFEKRIRKTKLPKGFSHVLQTSDVIKTLDVNMLDLYYNNWLPSIDLPKRPNWWYAILPLLEYHEYKHEHINTWDNDLSFSRGLAVFPVYGDIRKKLRSALVEDVLPYLRLIQGKYKGHELSVYYSVFNKENYEPLDRGGIYIVDKKKKDEVIFRHKGFNIDEDLKECLK